jgi:hypothetical protein
MKKLPFDLALLFGLFYLIGLGLLGYSMWSSRRSIQAASWPTTPGTITEVRVVETPSGGSDPPSGPSYEAQVRYSYAVDGHTYEGSRIAFGFAGSGDRCEQEVLAQHLLHARTVPVHYDPSDPSLSTLQTGWNRQIKLGLAFSIVWLTLTVGVMLAWWRLPTREDTRAATGGTAIAC